MERILILVMIVLAVGCVEEDERACDLPRFDWSNDLDSTEHVLVDGERHVHMCGSVEVGDADLAALNCAMEGDTCGFGFVTTFEEVRQVCDCPISPQQPSQEIESDEPSADTP